MEKKMKEQQGQYQNQQPEGNVGETVIAKKPNQPKESNKNVGDYVDYEEIND